MPNFIFCVHNHQPVGNFGYVIEDSYQDAYLPFLKTITKYPSVKLSLHITGYLLDWLLENHNEYIEMLSEMIKNGQVEMLGGGYYEPILTIIPPRDRIGQIRMMSDKLDGLFGKRPRGMWLAERIWEPQLPLYLKEAGIEYVVVDDYHFVKAGLKKEELAGYYITEDLGSGIKVFPGSERLRYIIPFEMIERFADHISWVSTLGSNSAAIFADDGEKFGTWPGTHQWVYKEGWFKKFLEAVVEKKDLIKPVTFSEYVDDNEPLGRVYLPTTSYMEMGEWALPAQASQDYANLVNEVKTWQDGERIRRFLQGGFWRNFLAKYPEANWMHKRMLLVSEEVGRQESRDQGVKGREMGSKDTQSSVLITRHLYKAQCNDAYWHGVFGGLYLPHLRTAVYENLIKAENLLEPASREQEAASSNCSSFTAYGSQIMEADFNADTKDEILIRTPYLNLFFDPHHGGSLIELDYKPKALNLSNTLSRWEEGYHHRVKVKRQKNGTNHAKSIHDLTASKDNDLEKYLFFDRYQRVSLLDHFFKREETIDAFRMSAYEELGDFFNKPYEKKSEIRRHKSDEEYISLMLNRDGTVSGQRVRVEKEISVYDDEIKSNYAIKSLDQEPVEGLVPRLEARFGVEFNLLLPGCEGMNGFCDIQSPQPPFKKGGIRGDLGIGSSGEIIGIRHMGLVDQETKIRLSFHCDKETAVWRFPIETVSLSEAGFEKVFQGFCILLFWDISLGKVFETSFTMKVSSEP